MNLIRWSACLLVAATLASAAEPTVLYTGTVTDLTGQPLEGVRLEVVTDEDTEEPASILTDKDGLFWVEAPGEIYLKFSKQGYLDKQIPASTDDEELLVSLIESAQLTVHVMDRDGKPLADITVQLHEGTGEAPEEDAEPIFEADSDKRGLAVFTDLPPGRYRLRVREDGYADRATTVSLQGGEREAAAIQLTPTFDYVVHGRVLDADEKPIRGARIGKADYDWSSFMRARNELRRPRRSWMRFKELAVSDEEGRYRAAFEANVPEVEQDEEQWLTLLVHAPDYAPQVLQVAGEWKPGATERDIPLERGGSYGGRVVNERGEGVPGVTIWAEIQLQLLNPKTGKEGFLNVMDLVDLVPSLDQKFGIVTDEEGRFRIPHLPDCKLYLRPWKEGYPQKTREDEPVEILAGENVLDAVLEWEEGAVIRGSVLNEQGDPLDEAAVRTTKRAPGQRNLSARTTADGQFHLGGLKPEERVDIEVSAKGFGRQIRRDIPGNGDPLTLVLRPGGSLSGRVFDETSGEPVTSFELTLEPRKVREELLGVYRTERFSEPEGLFTLEDISPGTYKLTLRAPDYVPEVRSDVEVREQEETPQQPFLLERGKILEGVVLDSLEKLPLAGVALSADIVPMDEAEEVANNRGRLVLGDTTGDQGQFRISGLVEGEVVVTARHPAYATTLRTFRLEKDDFRKRLDLVLGPGGILEVKALDEAGAPLEDATVILLHLVQSHAPDGPERRRRVDASGQARFDRRVPGPYRVSLQSNSAISEDVELEEGKVTTVTLRKRGVRVQGALSYGGKPVENGNLSLEMPDRRGHIGCTVESSRYDCTAVPPGTYTIRARGTVHDEQDPTQTVRLQHSQELEVAIEAGDQTLDLAFRVYLFSGHVLDKADNSPVPRAYFSVSRQMEDGSMRWGGGDRTKEDGSFHVRLPESGRYRIFLSHDSEHGPLTLEGDPLIEMPEEGSLENVNLILVSSSEVEGTVAGPDGLPVASARVGAEPLGYAASREGLPYRSVQQGWSMNYTDSEGWFHLKGLPQETLLLYAGAAGLAPQWIRFEPGPEAPRSVQFQLQLGGTLQLRLSPPKSQPDPRKIELTKPGLPLPIRLELGRGLRDGGYIAISADGDPILKHLPAGTWTVTVSGEGNPRQGVVEIENGGSHILDLSKGTE